MLGSAVMDVLSRCEKLSVDGTQRNDEAGPDYFDILAMPESRWSSVLQRRPYDYIINCIGMLKPAISESDSVGLRRAILVNALFPHQLASAVPSARIFHISTDGVFSGRATRPYLETDAADCPDAYGKTKALGECPAENVINFRCSIIGCDSRGGKGLIEWVLRSPEGTELRGFEDQYWNGVTTRQFAGLCRSVIAAGIFDTLR